MGDLAGSSRLGAPLLRSGCVARPEEALHDGRCARGHLHCSLLWICVREGGIVLAFPLGLFRLVLRRGVPLLDLLPRLPHGTAAVQASGNEEGGGARRELLP